ncbi:hypothetical protein NA655_04300 [Pseudomonas kuykendallii]|uniref:Uncharacterized protein n=1 Tax=Pseudomonas kuykendallii TaxID=1007099 RepID=A0A1H3DL02_9PSED|nr:hypothetical protein [Pseudomonas kuykendallii]MCQ4270240.1 hypothetical protein [Pseudomonas kuykendallii]SDX67116.1 hypothetical protein SAMN05216287_3469 [Pseudomonas kuykendallii]
MPQTDEKSIWKTVTGFLPFVGGLHRLKGKHFSGAAKEVAVTVLLATFPIWAGAFYGALSDIGKIESLSSAFLLYLSRLREALENGTLILYSASLIAPVLYLALEEKSDGNSSGKMPSPMSHILSVFVIQTAATIYYTKQMSLEVINAGFAWYSSVVMFIFTIFVLYIVHCHKHFTEVADPSRDIEDNALEFSAGYSRHRRAEQ